VHAGLGPQPAIRVLAVELDRGALDAGDFAAVGIDDLGPEAVLVAPAQVHAHQHVGPVLGLGAAGARLDVEEGAVRVHLAREHALELEPLELCVDRAEVLLDRPHHALVCVGLGHVEELGGLAGASRQFVEGGDHAIEPGPLATELLCALGVLPDGRVFEFAQYFGQSLALARIVKDTPSALRCAA
jgi:hypothetical protein